MVANQHLNHHGTLRAPTETRNSDILQKQKGGSALFTAFTKLPFPINLPKPVVKRVVHTAALFI